MKSLHFDTLILNGKVLLTDLKSDGTYEHHFENLNIGISNGKVSELGRLETATAENTVDASGLHVLPGLIDTQVHFREPGFPHKEDFESGTRAALKGGLTGVFDMPNTSPSTTTLENFQAKLNGIRGRAWVHYGLYAGASGENLSVLGELENMEGCCGVKIFMGSSTGTLLVDNEADLGRAFAAGKKRLALHCEDEARLIERKSQIPADATSAYHPIWRDEESALIATRKAVKWALKTKRKTHILHVSTRDEMEFLAEVFKDPEARNLISVEVTPQHLTLFAPDCYERWGSLAQMNPPIRNKNHLEGIWEAVHSGLVNLIGSDHAPHTLEEKSKPYPTSPAGIPGVQTLVPLMLMHIAHGRFTLEKLVEMTCLEPARLFSIKNKGSLRKGRDADLTFLDMRKIKTIETSEQQSRVGWTPFAGTEVQGWPVGVMISGHMSLWEEEIQSTPRGVPFQF